jgi:DNA-directed RNA polymerase subunit RPC12/RpoP
MILPVKKYLIVFPARDCPNCGSKSESDDSDFGCSVCAGGFCVRCCAIGKNVAEDADFVFCPYCGEKLFYPENVWMRIFKKIYGFFKRKGD